MLLLCSWDIRWHLIKAVGKHLIWFDKFKAYSLKKWKIKIEMLPEDKRGFKLEYDHLPSISVKQNMIFFPFEQWVLWLILLLIILIKMKRWINEYWSEMKNTIFLTTQYGVIIAEKRYDKRVWNLKLWVKSSKCLPGSNEQLEQGTNSIPRSTLRTHTTF